MKKLFFFLVVLFLPFMINSKELKLDDVVLRNKTDARVLQVLKANDGNYVITSLQRNTSADGGVSTVEKRDTNGHLMWEVVYGVSSDSSMIEFSSMAIASDDSIIIAGYFNETDDIELKNNGLYDGLLIKIDKDGNLLWQKSWGGSNHDFFDEVVLDQQDNIYICGSYSSTVVNDIDNKGHYDGILIKYDKDGNELWNTPIHGTAEDRVLKLAMDSKYNLLVFLITKSKEINGFSLPGDMNIVTLKYDVDGNLIWHRNNMIDKYSVNSGVHITEDDGYLLIVSTEVTEFEDVLLKGKKDIVIIRYDEKGNLLWKKSWGGSDSDTLLSTTLLENGELFVVGTTFSQDILEINNNLLPTSYILWLDKNGEFILEKNINVRLTSVYAINELENNVIISSYTLNSDYKVNGEKLGSGYIYTSINREGALEVNKYFFGNDVFLFRAILNENGRVIVLGSSAATEVPGFNEEITSTNNYWLEYSYRYDVELKGSENGTITSNQQGKYGIIAPVPDKGYELDKIIVKNSKNELIEVTALEDGTYSFELSDDVTIEVLFKEEVFNPKTGVSNIISLVFTFMLVLVSGLFVVKKYNKSYEL